MKRIGVPILLLAMSSACTIVIESGDSEGSDPGGDVADATEEPYVQTSYSTVAPEDAQCLAEGTACSLVNEDDKPCCAGTYCDALNGSAPDMGACTALVEDGGPCWANDQCAGGTCLAQVCTSQCSALGGVCDFNGGCCEGTICSLEIVFSYGPGECVLPQPDGEYCWQDSQCASGHCVDTTCTSVLEPVPEPEPEPAPEPAPEPEPLGEGEEGCWWDGDCVDGLFCDGSFAYAPGTCRAPLADGEYCVWHSACASGECHNNLCTSQCLQEQSICERGLSPCCNGTVCLDGGYGFGSCEPPLAAGEFCLHSDECASGYCDRQTYTCG
jgi:hypothetical protein